MNKLIPASLIVAWRYAHQSLLEFFFLVLLGLMPVWLGGLIKLGQGSDWIGYLQGYLSGGEALLLSTATVGPLLYLVVASDFGARRGTRRYPLKGWFVFAILLVCISSAGIFGFKEAHEGDHGQLSPSMVWWISSAVSVFSVALWFAVSTTNAVREGGAAAIMRQEEHDFVKGYVE